MVSVHARQWYESIKDLGDVLRYMPYRPAPWKSLEDCLAFIEMSIRSQPVRPESPRLHLNVTHGKAEADNDWLEWDRELFFLLYSLHPDRSHQQKKPSLVRKNCLKVILHWRRWSELWER